MQDKLYHYHPEFCSVRTGNSAYTIYQKFIIQRKF